MGMAMMKVFLILYQLVPGANELSKWPSGVVLQFPTEEACLEAVELFNSIGEGTDIRYAPHSLAIRAECTERNLVDEKRQDTDD
jgi:hypothetical protein